MDGMRNTSKLNLPLMSRLNQLSLQNPAIQRRTVRHATQRMQHLRDTVIGKHGNLVNVIEVSVGFASEASPKICHKDLCSF